MGHKATATVKAMMFCAWISSTAALFYELCLSKVHYEKKKEEEERRKNTKMAFLADFFLASRVLEGTFEGTTVMV